MTTEQQSGKAKMNNKSPEQWHDEYAASCGMSPATIAANKTNSQYQRSAKFFERMLVTAKAEAIEASITKGHKELIREATALRQSLEKGEA
jgi:hypothetical protein